METKEDHCGRRRDVFKDETLPCGCDVHRTDARNADTYFHNRSYRPFDIHGETCRGAYPTVDSHKVSALAGCVSVRTGGILNNLQCPVIIVKSGRINGYACSFRYYACQCSGKITVTDIVTSGYPDSAHFTCGIGGGSGNGGILRGIGFRLRRCRCGIDRFGLGGVDGVHPVQRYFRAELYLPVRRIITDKLVALTQQYTSRSIDGECLVAVLEPVDTVDCLGGNRSGSVYGT